MKPGGARRQIVLEDQPAPYVTTEAQVTPWRAEYGDANARLTAFEAWDRKRGLMRDTLVALRERRRITAHELRAGQCQLHRRKLGARHQQRPTGACQPPQWTGRLRRRRVRGRVRGGRHLRGSVRGGRHLLRARPARGLV